RRDQIAEEHLVGIAARLGGLVADGVIALFGVREIARRGEDDFAPSARETLAAAGGTRLDDDGMALAGAWHRERPTRLEELALVIEAFYLGRGGGAAAVLVDQQRAVLPAVPMAEHHFHESVCAVVAEVVIEMGVLAHIV